MSIPVSQFIPPLPLGKLGLLFCICNSISWASLVAQMVKNLSAMQET